MANETKKKAAKKAVKKVATKVATKPTPTPPAKKAAVKKVAVKKVAETAPPAAKAVKKVAKKITKKATLPKAPLTTIVAKIDVGFGNTLTLRGDSAGLSWDKGIVMGCADSNEWVWSSNTVSTPIEFKVLINDEVWAEGANAMVAPGERVVIEPTF